MTDAEWLSTLPRELSAEEVERRVTERDAEQGPYVPHHHHAYFEESRH